jgi:pimeloyl-ACP methyl ester carboxylesterase
VRRGWKIVIGVLTAIVLLVVVNTIVTDRDTEPAKADGGRIIDLPGGDLQVREDGPVNDPPIVLIHGWAASSDWFDRITPLLATGHHVVRVDLLGHGGSAKPSNGYTMEEQADRVALALERLGVRGALVAGHSTGGEVAIALAARHPELARRLAIIDTEPDEKYVPSDTLADLSVTPVIGETMKRLATDGTIRDGLGPAFEKGFDVPDQFVKDFNKLTYTAYKDTSDESADYVDEGHFARDLRAVKVPKLVIFGKDDRLVKPAAAETYHREFGLPVRLVAGAGHSPMVEQPAGTARLLLALERERSR